jgi:hypothetical protein
MAFDYIRSLIYYDRSYSASCFWQTTAAPRELFGVERLHLKPLHAWIPKVCRLHQRLVDVEGYVALNSNRYSVPLEWIGRRVEARETRGKIEIQLDGRRQRRSCNSQMADALRG